VKRLSATLAVLERELEQNPRVLSIGLHPHIAGVPHRLYYLEQALDLLMRRADTIFVTSTEIADWYIEADKTGVADLEAALRARPSTS
jgi:hypothetical protein